MCFAQEYEYFYMTCMKFLLTSGYYPQWCHHCESLHGTVYTYTLQITVFRLFHQVGFILPITIDSFRHMYMFPGTIEDIQ